jgi:hypothetical protein
LRLSGTRPSRSRAVCAWIAIATATPFIAPLRAVAYNLRHMTTDVSGQYDLWVFEFVALVFVAVVAIATTALSGTV